MTIGIGESEEQEKKRGSSDSSSRGRAGQWQPNPPCQPLRPKEKRFLCITRCYERVGSRVQSFKLADNDDQMTWVNPGDRI
jgi:hypothetical protein